MPLSVPSPAPGPRQVAWSGAFAERLERLRLTLETGGLDLWHPFALGALRGTRGAEGLLTGLSPHHLGLVLGNTKALWSAFKRHLRSLGVKNQADLGPDPLDIYVEELVGEALAEVAELAPVTVHYAHELVPRPIPIQRIAAAAGFAPLGPVHLSIHPEYGPWLALRAVLTVAVSAPLSELLPWMPKRPQPCDHCHAPCRRALSGALLGVTVSSVETGPPAPAGLSAQQRRWLAVRDVCPAGQRHRYSDDQILYHYDRDVSALFR